MRTLLTFILLLAVGTAGAAEQRFVPYNPATGATLGGIVYTNGTFHGNGSGLTNLNMTNVVGSRLDFGEGATITRGPGEVLEFSTEIVGAHVGTGDGLTNLNASNLSSGTVSTNRLPVIPNSLVTGSTNFSVSTNGVNFMTATSGVVNLTFSGTASDTGLSMTTGKNYGFYRSSFNRLAYAHSGSDQVAFGDALWLRNTIPISWTTVGNDPSVSQMVTGIRMLSAGTLEVVANNNTPGSLVVSNTLSAGSLVSLTNGITIPILSAAPTVAGNNVILWASNSSRPFLWITGTNGTFTPQ